MISFLSIASVFFFTDPLHAGAIIRGYGHKENDFHRNQMSTVLSRELSDKSEYPWDEVGLLLGKEGREEFGYSVAISDETDAVAVGSLKASDYKGGVSVFEKAENNTWLLMGEKLLGERFERTGWNVEISKDGKTLAYGDPEANDYTGVVNIFNWDNSTDSWNQMGSTITVVETQSLYLMMVPPLRWEDAIYIILLLLIGTLMLLMFVFILTTMPIGS